jgi:hypothetical protein
MKRVYLCEKCEAAYPTPKKALACEALHIPISEDAIIGVKYPMPKSTGIEAFDRAPSIPKEVTFRFGDWEVHYEYTRGTKSVENGPKERVKCLPVSDLRGAKKKAPDGK